MSKKELVRFFYEVISRPKAPWNKLNQFKNVYSMCMFECPQITSYITVVNYTWQWCLIEDESTLDF